MIPQETATVVMCSNKQKGADAKKACKNACIGCKKCEKTCPNGAITVIDNNNDSFTIVLDCVDDKGYKITGSVTANAYAGGYSAKSLSAKKSSPKYPTMKSMVVR